VSIPPFRLRFQNNDSFKHRERRWISRVSARPALAQDMIDFRKIHQDSDPSITEVFAKGPASGRLPGCPREYGYLCL